MHYRKLKQNWGLIIFYGIVFSALLGNIVLNYNEEQMFTRVFAILFLVSSVICFNSWLKTKNWWDLNFMLTCLVSALVLGRFIKINLLMIVLMIILIPLYTLHFYGLFKKINQRRYRAILELAARSVHESEDGFTRRPFPAGTIEYTQEEIFEFGKFLQKHLIVLTKKEKNGLRLIINKPGILWFQPLDSTKATYVSFDWNGNVSVNIAENDYRKYKDELTFDQLCASLGTLFKNFLVYYQKSENKKIISYIEENLQ